MMDDLLYRWLLVYLYHWATWMKNYAQRLQVTIRRALLSYASRAYNPKQPLTKPSIPWQQRLEQAEKAGKPISPIKHRKEMPRFLHCPNCSAPVEYLYNFGYEYGHSEEETFHKIRCKICGFQTVPFRERRRPHFFCPYCGYALVRTKEHSAFDVLKCKNKECPYRHKEALRAEAIKNGANPNAKAYIYRAFNIKFNQLQLTRPEKPFGDFARIHHSTTTVALALTFHIHLGLSLRETALWMKKLFSLPISHQTVANWTQSVAYLLEPLVSQHIEDASILVGDETSWWISYNPETTTLVAQLITTERNTQKAAALIKQTMEQTPSLSHFISDAFSAYALAILYLGQQGCAVPQHIVVKGLQYRGVPEDAFLWYKELIERFFRTFKQRYRRTLGFSSFNGAVAFCVLFCVYYNFFRPHARAEGKTPVQQFIDENVLKNWKQLIEIAIQQAA
ncbi:MAG: transposase [bacterium]